MFMTPVDRFAPWVLLVEQQSYLLHIKNVMKKILPTADPYTANIKNYL